MKSAKGHHNHHEDEEEDEEFGSKKDSAPSNNPTNSNNAKDGKNSDKANAIRSKHSVTEQRRRSKINERFQILRDLIPHSDQKRDTASFLLEVIQYVQYLQEKVQKYEGSYQAWSAEPTKLMPWRNSHWRIQSLVGNQQQAMKNGSGQGPMFPGRLDENNIAVPSSLHSTHPNPVESSAGRETPSKAIDPNIELGNRPMGLSIPQTSTPVPVQNDGAFSFPLPRSATDLQPTGCSHPADAVNQQEEVTVEGGTISISSVYSEGLLNSLSQALQTAGIDMSQATISVQINLGKQPNRVVTSGMLAPKDPENHPMPPGNQPMTHFQDSSNGEDSEHAHKRMKI